MTLDFCKFKRTVSGGSISRKILIENTEEEGNKIMDDINKLSNDLDIFISNIVEKYS